MIPASLEEDAVKIAPMHDRVRISEPLAKGFVQRNAGDLVATQGVHQPEIVDVDRHGSCRIADPR